MESYKKLSHIVTELFLRRRKPNISLVFMSLSYYKEPKTIRLNATHYFIMKIPNKRWLPQIPSNYSSDIIQLLFFLLYHQEMLVNMNF